MILKRQLAILSSFGVALLLLAGAEERPLTDEDVVRLFVAGHSTEAIVAEIERRVPAFDLSPEMLRELRNVDLPEAIIAAMHRRQDELRRTAEAQEQIVPEEETAPFTPPPALCIVLNPDHGSTQQTLGVRARIDPQFAAEWELGNAPDERVFADLALFLVCETPEHVPDHWRLASPLGRDFRSVRRHRLLQFVMGVPPDTDAADRGRRVKLELPTALEVPLEPGETHDLAVGLALQVGGRYIVVVQDRWPGAIVTEEGLELGLRVKGRKPETLVARFVREEDDEAGDDEAPPATGRENPVSPTGEKRPSKRPALPW